MKLIFTEDRRYKGYSSTDYSSKDKSEIVKETLESELNNIIPEGLEGGWREHRRKFKINEQKEIIFDKDYEPQVGEQ